MKKRVSTVTGLLLLLIWMPVQAQQFVCMEDGFAFVWDLVDDDGDVSEMANWTVEAGSTISNAWDTVEDASGTLVKSTRVIELLARNNNGDGCTFETDEFTYSGSRDGHLSYSGDWVSFCDGIGEIATGTWAGTFTLSSCSIASQPRRTVAAAPALGPQGLARAQKADALDGTVKVAAPVSGNVCMEDGFAFVWDLVDDDGDVSEMANWTVEAGSTISNAWDTVEDASGTLVKSTRVIELLARNNNGDGCTFETDEFTYSGSRDGHLSYSGDWVSFCDGIGEIATGTWAGTFTLSSCTAGDLSRGALAGPAMGPAARARTAGAVTGLQGQVQGLGETAPAGFVLDDAYPNPFNPTTMIRYTLPEASHVNVTVYNALGQQVAVLAEGYQDAGQHQVTFDASGLSNGIYLYVIRAGTFTATKQMMLLK